MRYNSKTLEMELTLNEALKKGIEAHKAGKVQDADQLYTAILKAQPKHPDANHNMGVLAVGVGKVEQALPFFKTALEVNQTIAQFWLSYIDALIKLNRMDDARNVLNQAKSNGLQGEGFDQLEQRLDVSKSPDATMVGHPDIQDPPQDQAQQLVDLYSKGQFQEALNQALHLLREYPSSPVLYNIVGASYKGLGKQEEAIEAYKKAISLKPDYAYAYKNLGNALKVQGDLEEAVEAFSKAISIKPYYVEAYIDMGNALRDQGKLKEAIEAYTKALSLKPSFAEAYNNLGVLFQEQGKPDEALEAYSKALSIRPDYAGAYNNLSNVLKGIIFTKPNRDIQKMVLSLLDRARYIRPKDSAKAAISLLKLEPDLQKYLKVVDTEVIESLLDVISDLSEFPLLLKLMSVCPLPDLELEGLLTNLRFAILSNVLSLKEASPKLLNFQSALVLQCFTNEYIYSHTEEEEKILQSLDASVKKALNNNEQPSPQAILALASYKALNEYDWCKLLVVTDEIKEVFTRQVEEPNAEEKLKQDLPTLEEITDSVSSKVRDQYEESPYPRWVNLGLPLKPLPVSKIADENKLKLHDNKITEVEKPDILIAGCGTGQHSIGTAATFKGSKVLAIDLSQSSLAYAKRKTEELAIKNIEYMQADILDLGQLNKKFDIIESGGVLHHMDNPMAGWKVLTECLKPGGLMRIGLYSEIAREHIVVTRNEINQQSIGLSGTEIKSFRNMIMNSEKRHYKRVIASSDFYSLSTLKDLLFHVQEHRFTLPQIKDHLDELGLKFCGFELNITVTHFKQTNTDKDDLYDLDKWQAYEEANPRAFDGMYQFWCQKVA